jgi:quinohemoprotein ethanol dehydrogenase
MQAPKNGFFYVLDRVTGELLSAEPYVQTSWATGVDGSTGRPIEVPEARFKDAPMVVFPSPYGGHNWHPMAYSPLTGLVYIPALEMPNFYGNAPAFQYTPGLWNLAVDNALTESVPPEFVAGHLAAWDPVKQEEVWRVQYPLTWAGGVLATAGNLVFQGVPGGTFAAYRASDGAKLWEVPSGSGIIAPPVTYAQDGEQYVAVMAGWGGAFALVGGDAARAAGVRASPGRLLVFKLGGAAELPAPQPLPSLEVSVLESEASAEEVREGFVLFNSYCVVCHGFGAVGGGVLPDLRLSEESTYATWDQIVLEGSFSSRGMPSFANHVSSEQLGLIKSYVIDRRNALAVSGAAGAAAPPGP